MMYCFMASEHDEISSDYSAPEPGYEYLIKLNLQIYLLKNLVIILPYAFVLSVMLVVILFR